MKSTVVTLLLVLMLLLCIRANNCYINEVKEIMNEQIHALPDPTDASCTDAAGRIRDYWAEQKAYVGLSVEYNVVDRVSEQATALFTCAQCQDLYGYYTARSLLADAVEDMSRLEQFSLENIF